jgi:hypothetical protein
MEPRSHCRSSQGKRGLYRAKFDVGAPWDCPRFPGRASDYGQIGAATLNTSVRVTCTLRCVRLCLAKYHSLLVGKFRQKYRRLRIRLYRQLHQQLHTELNLAFDLDLDASLLGTLFKSLFATLFQRLFTALFGSMLKSKFEQL